MSTDFLIKALEEQDYLCHHGILGQKWGVRRYQNPDRTLTKEGRKKYGKNSKLIKLNNDRDHLVSNISKLSTGVLSNNDVDKIIEYGSELRESYREFKKIGKIRRTGVPEFDKFFMLPDEIQKEILQCTKDIDTIDYEKHRLFKR